MEQGIDSRPIKTDIMWYQNGNTPEPWTGVPLLYSPTNVTDDTFMESLCILTNLWGFRGKKKAHRIVPRIIYFFLNLSFPWSTSVKGKVKLVKFLFEIFMNVRTRVTLARMDFKEKVSGNVFFLRRFIFMFITIKSWSWILPRKKSRTAA